MTKIIAGAEIHADPVTVLSYEDFLLEEPFTFNMSEELEFDIEETLDCTDTVLNLED